MADEEDHEWGIEEPTPEEMMLAEVSALLSRIAEGQDGMMKIMKEGFDRLSADTQAVAASVAESATAMGKAMAAKRKMSLTRDKDGMITDASSEIDDR